MKGCGRQIHPSSRCGEVCYTGKMDYCSNCEKELLVENERNRVIEIIKIKDTIIVKNWRKARKDGNKTFEDMCWHTHTYLQEIILDKDLQNNNQNKTVATKRLDACPSAQSKDVIGCNKSYYSDNPQDDSGVSSKLAKEDNGKSTFPVDLKSTAQKDKKITKTDICEGN